MVSITGITAGQASEYYQSRDNYYTKGQGQWHGKGAGELGLAGPVEKEEFDNILVGKDKERGRRLSGLG